MKRTRGGFLLSLVAVVALAPASARASERVRSENGRFWVECRNAPLSDMLREIAAVSPTELWLDEGLKDKHVTVSVADVTMKKAVEKLFENVKVNYVLYLDPGNPERVAKIYVGGSGGGRLAREPTLSSGAPPTEASADGPVLPPDLDPDALLQSPEAQEVLGALKSFLDQQGLDSTGADDSDADADPDPAAGLPKEIQDLLKNVPEFPRSPYTPGLESPPPPSPPADENVKNKKK